MTLPGRLKREETGSVVAELVLLTPLLILVLLFVVALGRLAGARIDVDGAAAQAARAASIARDPATASAMATQTATAALGSDNVTCAQLSVSTDTAQFQPGEEARASYPYDYEFTVSYRFEPLALFVELRLRNLDTKPIPWSAGHHFYFTLPWNEARTRADYFIRIPAGASLRQDFENGRLHPGPRLRREESLASKDLIDVFHTALKSNAVVFGERDGEDKITVHLGPDRVPPKSAVVVTWTQADDSPFYCVEPWMGPANSPEHKAGLYQVAPSETQSFLVEVSLK